MKVYIGDIGLLNICVMSKEMVDYGLWLGKVTVSYYSLCPTTIVHIERRAKILLCMVFWISLH